MRVICMDCLEDLGTKPNPDDWDQDYEPISHGLCKVCLELRRVHSKLERIREELNPERRS